MSIFDKFSFNKKPQLPTPLRKSAMDFASHNYNSVSNNLFHGRMSEYDLTDPRIIENGKYIMFGQDNMYPNHVNRLFNQSGLHHSIVEFKKSLIATTFNIEEHGKLTPVDKLQLTQMLNQFDGDRDLTEVLNEITLDLLLHNTIYFKLFWNNDKTRLLKIKRIDPAKLRLKQSADLEEVEAYYYNFDWTQGRYQNTEIPAYKANSDEKIEIYRFIKKNPQANFYTLPSWSSGANWIKLDGAVSDFQKSALDNSINPSMIVKIPQDATPEEKGAYMRKIESNFQGSSNAGRAMVFFGDGMENLPDVESVPVSNLDKQFSVTADAIQRGICYANNIDPIIMGIAKAGALGSQGNELAFEILIQSTIQPLQRDIEKVINKIAKFNKLPITFTLDDTELYSDKGESTEAPTED